MTYKQTLMAFIAVVAFGLGILVGLVKYFPRAQSAEPKVHICEDNLSDVKYGDPNEIYCG